MTTGCSTSWHVFAFSCEQETDTEVFESSNESFLSVLNKHYLETDNLGFN